MRTLAFISIVAICLLLSCSEKEKSSESSILSFEISAASQENLLSSQIQFDSENKVISVFSPENLPDNIFPVSLTPEVRSSSQSKLIPESGTEITFTDKDACSTYRVTAEDGTVSTWYVLLRDNQLPNADFDDWFETTGMNSQPFLQPGRLQETTVWATANMGTSIYGVYCTNPLEDGDNTLVEIITGETEAVPVTAGTLFTGKFDISGAINNPTDPERATDFGIPFIYRPKALRLKYSYQSGEDYIRGTLNDPENIFGGFTVDHLEGKDSCKIYSFLEAWNDDQKSVIAGFLFFTDDTGEELEEITIPYTYYLDQNPTHITLVFTSSKDGALYTGSVGSKLIIDDLEFIYD